MDLFHVVTDAKTGKTVQVPFTEKEAFDYSTAAAEAIKTAYIAQRAAEYPPITDYIDGVVKGDQTQVDTYIAACLAVKTKYPKP